MAVADSAVIREPVAADAEAIARVHVDSWRETYSGMLHERYFSEDAFARRTDLWTRYLSAAERPGRMVVAERDGAIIGFANSGNSIGPDAEHGFPPARPVTLFSIYLLAAAHGTGAGQGLHDAVVDRAPAQLWVLRGNARAISFYTRNGFEFDGVEFIDPRDPDLVELRMVR